MKTDFDKFNNDEMDMVAEGAGCAVWTAILLLLIAGVFAAIFFTSCVPVRYVDDFQDADTVYLYDTNQLFIIDNGKVVQVDHYPIKMW